LTGAIGATASRLRLSSIGEDLAAGGTMNAQISANGQITPPVATPTQPATLTAAA
jgi:hypothetical protein